MISFMMKPSQLEHGTTPHTTSHSTSSGLPSLFKMRFLSSKVMDLKLGFMFTWTS